MSSPYAPSASGLPLAGVTCELCDERLATRLLQLDERPVAACSRCAADLRRDGIDLEDEDPEA